MRDHQKLRAFHLADELALLIYSCTSQFPDQERFGLTSQIRRAAISVPSNIVEGCAKQSEADYLRFLDIAYGSACEVQYQLTLANRLGFMSPSEFSVAHSHAVETCKVLGGLIRAVRNS